MYPYGATLNVAKPAVALLSTGSCAFPLARPICALYQSQQDVLFQFLTSDEVHLNAIDAGDPEVSDYGPIPALGSLSEGPFSCLQEGEEPPADPTELFQQQLYSLDNSLLPSVIRAYEEVGVPHEPLRLISPQFESPLPPLQPAVFPPSFQEADHPALELFDLDEALSSESRRLAQLANKCTDQDLHYYLVQCGQVVGVPTSSADPRQVLEHVLAHLVEFRKLNQLKLPYQPVSSPNFPQAS
ncbi:hypothetical protein HPB47_025916 [Ixodes persulcatus]|uniref:Uncharacterized protein n=1 Tax=Ixodes persulcatus TaxID=34615 RepID=A0AC60Q067_IXOPE|nr:hypothetical protein HPB47_025916 [Ixodes persulcatus]